MDSQYLTGGAGGFEGRLFRRGGGRGGLHGYFLAVGEGVGGIQDEPVVGGEAAGDFVGGGEIAAGGHVLEVNEVRIVHDADDIAKRRPGTMPTDGIESSVFRLPRLQIGRRAVSHVCMGPAVTGREPRMKLSCERRGLATGWLAWAQAKGANVVAFAQAAA